MTIKIELEHRFLLSYQQPVKVETGPSTSHTEYITMKRSLCFTHAVLHAMKGEQVELEIDQTDYEYDGRTWSCEEC